MISRLIVVSACIQVLNIVVTCHGVTGNNTNNVETTIEPKILENNDNEIVNARVNVDSKRAINIRVTGIDDQSDFINPWYADVPLLPIAFASSMTLPDGPCKKQAQLYLRHLRNGTLWATRMYDSSTKYPDGLISGHTTHFGDFDGCYNLRAKLPHNEEENNNDEDVEINGRYCLVDVRYEKNDLSPIKTNQRHDLEFDPNDSAWEAVREKGDFRRVKRYQLQLALCVPEVCSSYDIEAALQGPMKKFGIEKNLNLDVSVKPHFCQAMKDTPEFSLSAKIYCYILAGLIILVIISTWYDLTLSECVNNTGSKKKDLVLCFSARRNFNAIMEPTTGQRGLETLHLMRFVYLTLTMIGHRTVEYYTGPVINYSYMEWLYKFKTSMIVLAGPQVVEAFFSYGGLLVAYSLLSDLDTNKRINFFGPIIIRFLRLTPSYMLIVFFNALLLPYLGSGPYWEWKIGFERDNCGRNWWTNFLYLNNYINPEKACMFQSWYLAVDYHLYIIALVVVYLFWRMPRKIGYFFLTLIILGGCVIPFVNTYFYGVQPLYMGLLHMQEVREDPYFTGHYVKTHERLTSYFIGVLFGAVIYDHGHTPWQLGKKTSNVLFILFVVVFSIGSEIVGHQFFDPNAHPPRLEAAIYASLHKGVFAISACAIPAFITFGDGMNFHYKFLTPRWVQPLARLTYGAYLVHTVHHLYDVGVTRSARAFGIHNMFWDYIPDVAFTFALSLLLALMVEGPFRRIEKRFITNRERIEPINNNVEKVGKKTN